MKRLIYILFCLPFLGLAQETIDLSRMRIVNAPTSPTCSDGVQNGDETGIDCGGSCAPCSSLPEVDLTLVVATAYEFDLSSGQIDFCLDAVNSTGADIMVSYLVSGTGSPGVNFVALSGTITIPDGSQCASLMVSPINDVDAIDQTVTITISDDEAYTVGVNDEETVTIVDDDAAVSSCSPDPSPIDVNNISQLLALSPGDTFNLTNSIDLTGQSIPANLIYTNAGGGLFSGSNVDLNGMCVADDFTQKFLPSTTFANVNEESRVSPQAFGAIGNGIVADDIPINTLINYFRYGIGEPSSVYVKNSPSTFTRSGEIDFDWNGSEMKVTSTANFPMETLTTGYVMTFDNLNVIFSNGNFSGGDVYGRAFRFNGQNKIHFINNNIYDWYAPVTIRCVAFYMDFDNFDSFGGGVQDILFDGNTMYDIIAQGDGNFNNSPAGIAKGWWYSIGGMSDTSTFSIIHRNNTVYNVIGDDAEAWYAIGGTEAVNPNGTWLIENEYYYNNTRRNIKANISNLTIQNSTFEEIDNSLFNDPVQMGSNVDIFRTPSAKVRNIVVHNNVFRARPGQDYHYHMLSITEAIGVTITDNEFRMNQVENYAGLRLGSGTSTYTGYLEAITASGNDFYNCGIQMLPYYAPVDQIDIGYGTMTYDPSSNDWGAHQAAIRTTNNSGTVGNIDFHDYVVNISGGAASLFHGLIYSQGANMTNLNISDVQLNYSGTSLTNSVGWLVGDFGATNSIINLTTTGDATPTLNIDGAGSPTISGDSPTIIFN